MSSPVATSTTWGGLSDKLLRFLPRHNTTVDPSDGILTKTNLHHIMKRLAAQQT